MMTGKHSDTEFFSLLSFQQISHISKDLFILIFHVLPHFSHIIVKELKNQIRYLVA